VGFHALGEGVTFEAVGGFDFCVGYRPEFAEDFAEVWCGGDRLALEVGWFAADHDPAIVSLGGARRQEVASADGRLVGSVGFEGVVGGGGKFEEEMFSRQRVEGGNVAMPAPGVTVAAGWAGSALAGERPVVIEMRVRSDYFVAGDYGE